MSENSATKLLSGCVSLSKKENHTNRPRLVMAIGE
jgi:hypothetical protein